MNTDETRMKTKTAEIKTKEKAKPSPSSCLHPCFIRVHPWLGSSLPGRDVPGLEAVTVLLRLAPEHRCRRLGLLARLRLDARPERPEALDALLGDLLVDEVLDRRE